MVRYLALVSSTVLLATGVVILVDSREEPGLAASSVRGPDRILGAPRYGEKRVERYARSVGCSRYIMRTIPIYYRLAPRRDIAPDVLVAQAIVETGRGHYGGDSRPWNMAGIKKGGPVGDAPKDFERPETAFEGVRMHVNHMAAYAHKRPIGAPHDRFHDARAAQKARGWWVRRIGQLGDGVWAEDPAYARKIRYQLDRMGRI
jgi:Mannosyl-glycoprotein endo-beta-N-acetylglucosaminidase